MLKLLSHLCILILGFNHASATTCHELHQSQLVSLNERMNQMIDTISSLLPKPLKKPKLPETLTPTPSLDYVESTPSNETPYTPPSYTPIAPPTYTQVPPSQTFPQVMYVTPSFSPTPRAVMPPPISNPIPLVPSYYPPMGTALPIDYAFPSTSNLIPGYSRPRPHYPYEIVPNPVPVSNPPPYPPIPFSPFQQYPLAPVDYNRPPHEYLPAPSYPNTPLYPYSPGLPPYPLPVYTMQPPRYS